MSPTRLETFADGVFAIAATLLILNVDAQVPGDVPDLGAQLRHIWPSYVAYAASFVTIGIMWINHHTIMSQVAKTDRRFLVANIGLLLCIAFFPFTTRLVAEHVRGSGAQDAALAYGFTAVTTAVMFNITWFYAALGRRLLRDDADPAIVSGISARLHSRPVDLPGGDARRVPQPGHEHHPVRADRPLLRGRELDLRQLDLERGEQRVHDARVELRAAAGSQLCPRPLGGSALRYERSLVIAL